MGLKDTDINLCGSPWFSVKQSRVQYPVPAGQG